MLATPLHVSLLVHYNGMASDYPTQPAPAVEEYIQHLLTAKLLKRTPARARKLLGITAEFRTTKAGQKMVDKFCNVLAQHYTMKVVRKIYGPKPSNH